MHPADAERMGIARGDLAAVQCGGEQRSFPVEPRKSVPAGFAYLQLSSGAFIGTDNPSAVRIKPINREETEHSPSGRSHV